MIRRLLIANRGEIAARVIRTARGMGIETVAVYSDADAGAVHVRAADRAFALGGVSPQESYLDQTKILAAAAASGADAIHPGYGFLSENPEFVDAVSAAGLTFVGPSADAIRAMGLKDAAKAAMAAAGVPVVPGYHGEDQEPGLLELEAATIGYPLMIKAVAGGGGKGMRIVTEPAQFVDALESCKAEARTAFGNDAVLLERFIETPRHIEMQVFGDSHGQVVHLFERDCSLQRRHQKVIEEAPAPGMTDEVRDAMGAAAVRAAEAIGYEGAGTVEFIVDGSGPLRPDGFWFMEMNTRLQVEHPVTEAVTGLDLVEWQLRVARGERLPLTQDQISLSGHAVEARLYAEDPESGFLPSIGRLDRLHFPDRKGLRVDAGVVEGDTVTPHYDPMIAKVISHAPDRTDALALLASGLDATQVAGPKTNLGFLAALLRHNGFSRGEMDTGLIGRDLDALTSTRPARAEALAAAALAEAGLMHAPPTDMGFSLWAPLRWSVTIGDTEVLLVPEGPDGLLIEANGSRLLCTFDGTTWRSATGPLPPVHLGARTITVFDAPAVAFDRHDPLDRGGASADRSGVVEAPMPGLLRDLFAKEGQTVAEGDRLAVLEAMKMEHVLSAPRSGRISEVLAEAGDQVAAGAPLVRFAQDEDEGEAA